MARGGRELLGDYKILGQSPTTLYIVHRFIIRVQVANTSLYSLLLRGSSLHDVHITDETIYLYRYKVSLQDLQSLLLVK